LVVMMTMIPGFELGADKRQDKLGDKPDDKWRAVGAGRQGGAALIE
jgi:hypothetical protein